MGYIHATNCVLVIFGSKNMVHSIYYYCWNFLDTLSALSQSLCIYKPHISLPSSEESIRKESISS